MIDKLQQFLATIPPGPITDTSNVARLLANAWNEFTGDGGRSVWPMCMSTVQELQLTELLGQPPDICETFVLDGRNTTLQPKSLW